MRSRRIFFSRGKDGNWNMVCLNRKSGGLGGEEPRYHQQNYSVEMVLAICKGEGCFVE